MKHKDVEQECKALGLSVQQEPATGAKAFSATGSSVRVYWRTSDTGMIVGLPRVAVNGMDTHARSVKEIRYLVRR